MTLKNKIMTKKLITLIMAVLLPLSAFQMSADEKEAKPIPIKKSLVNHMTRTQYSLPIESYYLGMVDSIQTSVTSDLSMIEMTVTNLTTGETWSDSFESVVTPHLLQISGAPGLYEITYLTTFGDLYEGTFTIE